MGYHMAILGPVPWPCLFYCYWHRHSRSICLSYRIPLCWPDFTQADLERWIFRRTSLAPGHCGARFYWVSQQGDYPTCDLQVSFTWAKGANRRKQAWIHQKDEDGNETKHWETRAGVGSTNQKWSCGLWQAGTWPECESQKVVMCKRQKAKWKKSWTEFLTKEKETKTDVIWGISRSKSRHTPRSLGIRLEWNLKRHFSF